MKAIFLSKKFKFMREGLVNCYEKVIFSFIKHCRYWATNWLWQSFWFFYLWENHNPKS